MGKHQVEQRAVFLDRDGVLNRPLVFEGGPHPPASVVDFHLYDDVADGCARLKDAGFLLVVVTNQPDVGRDTKPRRSRSDARKTFGGSCQCSIASRSAFTQALIMASRAHAENRSRGCYFAPRKR